MSTCGRCDAPGQPEGARFCYACGGALAPGCSHCGAEIVPGARFCSNCGVEQDVSRAEAVPAPPVASRRVTSVLFGDLVGFTALAEGRDQEQVRELLSRYFDESRAIIERYGGTVEKFVGDAVMAVWGVPTAHEDDAERAVRAGLELVAAVTGVGSDAGVSDLAMRVGIVTGEVAVTIGATQQGMVAGDAVNTAARVQSAAAPGQVWVDETTRLLTSSAITYVDAGTHAFKGKAEPMPLWSVRAVVAAIGGAQRADGLEAPLVGREREMRLIKELFHQVEETRRPALLVVDGEAGVGKSRLAWEFEKYTDGLSAGVFWHSGRCLSYGEGVAFYPLAESIRTRLRRLYVEDTGVSTDESDDAAALDAGLARRVVDREERDWLRPRMAALLGIGGVGSFSREDLFSAWVTFLQRLSEAHASGAGTVVLLIDDAQHADDGLVAFLEYLLTVGSFPCFVALLTRPGLLEDSPSLATNRRSAVVHLDALPERDMAQLLDGLVAGLDDAARDALVRRAEGIPLYAVETVRSLIDRDLVVPRGGQYVRADDRPLDLDRIGAPASLHALVAARLDALSPVQRAVIDQASVAGLAFTRDAIVALCADVLDLDDQLAALIRLQLLRQVSDRLSNENGQYLFVQAVVRQVAYGTLSRRDRKRSHLVMATMLGAVEQTAEIGAVIAGHYLEAIDAVPDDPDVAELTDRAVAELRRAAMRAGALGAPAEAAGHLRTALERTQDPVLHAGLEVELARALVERGDHAELESAILHATHARDAFDALGDELGAARACAVLLDAALDLGPDVEGPAEVARERYDALRDRQDAGRVLLGLVRSRVRAQLRLGRDFGALAEEHARLAERVGDDADTAESHVDLGLHYLFNGVRALGRVLLGSAADVARRNHDLVILDRALINLAVSWADDDVVRAVGFGREAVAVGRQAGALSWTSVAAANLASAHMIAGDWDDVAAVVEDVAGVDRLIADLNLTAIALARGSGWRPPQLVPAGGVTEDLRGHALLAQALVAHGDGDPVAPELALAAVEAVYVHGGLVDDFALIWQLATEILWACHARPELQRALAIVDDHRGSRPGTGIRAQRARMAGLLAGADGDDTSAEIELRRAVALAEEWHSAPTVARCRAGLGVVLLRTSRFAEGERLLAEARAAYAELGATRWAEQLDRTMLGIGAR